MTENENKRLPQNIQNLIMEIGEKSVLFRIFLLVKDTDWNVFYNLNEVACDLILINKVSNDKIKIEVKTRQRLYSTSSNLNTTQFTLTELEKNSSNFVVCYWYEENAFFIVPTDKLTKSKSKEKKLYKFTVRKLMNGNFDTASTEYLNNWKLIQNVIN